MRRPCVVVAALFVAFPVALCATPASAEPLQLVPTAVELVAGAAPAVPVMVSPPTGPDFFWRPGDNLAMCVDFSNDLTPGLAYTLVLTATGGNSQLLGSTAAIVQTGIGRGTAPSACVPGGVFGAYGAATYTATAAAVVVLPPGVPLFEEPNECTQSPTRTVCVN